MAGSISAQVIDITNSQPISGVSVALGGPKSEKTTTGDDGKFKFSDLPPANNYTLDVSHDGYRTEHYEDIVVIDNVDTNLGFLAMWPLED